MLIDEFLAQYNFHEGHKTIIRARKEVVRRALEEWQPQDSFFWRLFLRLRGLGKPRGTLREWARGNGFICLAETEEEVVYGQIGRFWAVNERRALISPATAEEFRRFDSPNYAIAVINVRLEPLNRRRTRVYTETRVRTIGPQARWLFRLYWLLIKPFSGLLRRAMLNGIRRRALARAAIYERQEMRSL